MIPSSSHAEPVIFGLLNIPIMYGFLFDGNADRLQWYWSALKPLPICVVAHSLSIAMGVNPVPCPVDFKPKRNHHSTDIVSQSQYFGSRILQVDSRHGRHLPWSIRERDHYTCVCTNKTRARLALNNLCSSWWLPCTILHTISKSERVCVRDLHSFRWSDFVCPTTENLAWKA